MKFTCPECDSKALFKKTNVLSGTAYGPKLLPQLGGLFLSATFDIVMCADCGLTRFYASEEARAKVREKWRHA